MMAKPRCCTFLNTGNCSAWFLDHSQPICCNLIISSIIFPGTMLSSSIFGGLYFMSLVFCDNAIYYIFMIKHYINCNVRDKFCQR